MSEQELLLLLKSLEAAARQLKLFKVGLDIVFVECLKLERFFVLLEDLRLVIQAALQLGKECLRVLIVDLLV